MNYLKQRGLPTEQGALKAREKFRPRLLAKVSRNDKHEETGHLTRT